jgi:hypothetical protein
MLPELKDLVARGLFTRMRPAGPTADVYRTMWARTAQDVGDREAAEGARGCARPARAAHGQRPRARRVRGPARGAPLQARCPPLYVNRPLSLTSASG